MIAFIFLLLTNLNISYQAYAANEPLSVAEDFKGPAPTHDWTLGLQFGLGHWYTGPGFPFLVSVGKKIVHQGWVSEINNAVFAELQGGPLLTNSGNGVFLGTHARWDFVRDETLTLFAIGGLATAIRRQLGNLETDFFPRFGIGAFYALGVGRVPLFLRAEISHENSGIGLTFCL